MSDEAVRKEFEAWADANGISLARLRNDFYDGYGSDGTKRAWDAWQAARSAAMSRMEEFLQKLAWAKEDIESWRNWMSH